MRSSGGHDTRFSRDPLLVFSAGGNCAQFRHGLGCPLFDAVHQAFALDTKVSPSLQGALKDGFGEAVVACGIPKPSKFPSLGSCQKRFLCTHKEVDLPPQSVVGLVLQEEDAEKFPQTLGFERLDLFPESASKIRVFSYRGE